MSTINKHISGLTVKCFEMPNASYTNRYQQAKEKSISGNITVRKKENETALPQNSTFASPSTPADASACKRAVFLPTHIEIG